MVLVDIWVCSLPHQRLRVKNQSGLCVCQLVSTVTSELFELHDNSIILGRNKEGIMQEGRQPYTHLGYCNLGASVASMLRCFHCLSDFQLALRSSLGLRLKVNVRDKSVILHNSHNSHFLLL